MTAVNYFEPERVSYEISSYTLDRKNALGLPWIVVFESGNLRAPFQGVAFAA